MITFDEITKSYGRQEVFGSASFQVSRGDRVGVVGPNGAGKTTLFRLILGQERPDQGAVHKAKGLTVGHLDQEVGEVGSEPLLRMVMATVEDLRTVEEELARIELALQGEPGEEEALSLAHRQSALLERFDHLDGYTLRSRAEKILHGLGFKDQDFDRPVEVFSGGWRMRALLARILLSEPELILLDEPTNHLDLSSMLWLEEYLSSLTATVMIVSHDRTFLNRTVTRIIELEGGGLSLYNGNYDAYTLQKKEKLTHLASAAAKQKERIRQMTDFIDRNRTRKDKARQAQARLKALAKMELIELPEESKEISFSFPPGPRPPAVLVELAEVGLTYGGSDPIFNGLTARVGREERIALVGPNGAGKSSLLKLLAGELEPEKGARRAGGATRLAYFAQHQTEQLNPNLTVLEELMTVSGQASQTAMRTLLGAFLFSGEEVGKKVSVLSGGERSRLVLAKLLFSGANLLLLDEPTNHLDIPSRTALERALKSWPGALVLVTHDRRLIDAVANRTWEISPGDDRRQGARLTIYPGNLNDYLTTWQRLKAEPKEKPGTDPAEVAQDPGPAETRPKGRRSKAKRREEAEARRLVSLRTKGLKRRLTELEERAAKKEAELEELNQRLSQPTIYNRPDEAARLSQLAARVREELEGLGEDWSQAAMELEAAAEAAQGDR